MFMGNICIYYKLVVYVLRAAINKHWGLHVIWLHLTSGNNNKTGFHLAVPIAGSTVQSKNDRFNDDFINVTVECFILWHTLKAVSPSAVVIKANRRALERSNWNWMTKTTTGVWMNFLGIGLKFPKVFYFIIIKIKLIIFWGALFTKEVLRTKQSSKAGKRFFLL